MSVLQKISIGCVTLLLLTTDYVPAQTGISPNRYREKRAIGMAVPEDQWGRTAVSDGKCVYCDRRGDANAVFGNPASMADVKNYDVQLNALQWIADISHQSAAVAVNMGDAGVFGVSVAMLGYGDIPETINLSSGTTGTTPTVTGMNFTANDVAAGLSYARKITDQLSVGGNVRWMQQHIAELSMQNWSLDFGTMYHTGFRSLRIAITARNFGPDSRFGGWSEEYQTESDNVRMPLDFRAGIAMDFFDEPESEHLLTVVLEGDHPNDGREKMHLGASYVYDEILFLRGGWKFNYDVQRFTFGAGVNYPMGVTVGSISYAYVDFGELTQVHMFSLGFSF